VHIQRVSASGTSDVTSTSGGATLGVPVVSFSALLHAPGWTFEQGELRPAFRGSFFVPINTETVVTSKSVDVPPAPFSEFQADSRFSVEWDYGWSAGAGISWAPPIEYDILITPYLEYTGTKIAYKGEFGQTGIFPNEPNPVTIEASDSLFQHFLGPALSVDAAFAPVGDFLLTAFLEGGYYWLLSDSESDFGATGFDINGAPVTAEFAFESGASAGQVRFGFRVEWD
jgi:hypothetical protein